MSGLGGQVLTLIGWNSLGASSPLADPAAGIWAGVKNEPLGAGVLINDMI